MASVPMAEITTATGVATPAPCPDAPAPTMSGSRKATPNTGPMKPKDWATTSGSRNRVSRSCPCLPNTDASDSAPMSPSPLLGQLTMWTLLDTAALVTSSPAHYHYLEGVTRGSTAGDAALITDAVARSRQSGGFVTPFVLQKLRSLVAFILRRLCLRERLRPRFALFRAVGPGRGPP